MSIRKIQVTALPYPVYTLQIGSLSLNLSHDYDPSHIKTWVPRFTSVAQVVEVYRRGNANHCSLGNILDRMLSSYLIIEGARPELFLRRDFIQNFVKKGQVHATSSEIGDSYKLSIVDNTLNLQLTDVQYRRFGLTAGKVISHPDTKVQSYRISIDLNDDRILNSNKFQDKMVQTLRRLDPLRRLHFRFHPMKRQLFNDKTSVDKQGDGCLEYFQYVIAEYDADGLKPVPLTACMEANQTISRKWTNYSQPKPSHVDLTQKSIQSNDREALDMFTGLLDWMGFQVLSLDCNHDGKATDHASAGERAEEEKLKEKVDVFCAEICDGTMDSCQVGQYLESVFTGGRDSGRQGDAADEPIFRALILYSANDLPGSLDAAGSNSLFWSDWSDNGVEAEQNGRRLGWMSWSS